MIDLFCNRSKAKEEGRGGGYWLFGDCKNEQSVKDDRAPLTHTYFEALLTHEHDPYRLWFY